MLVDYINHLVIFQYFLAIIVWFFSLFLLGRYLDKSSEIIRSKRIFFLCYYIILSIVAVIRIFSNFLPVTPDSFMYLKAAENIHRDNNFFLLGALVYSNIIFFIKAMTFDNHYAIIFLNNFIFVLGLIELLKILPQKNIKSFWVWCGFLLIYPSVYWFVPNVLREAIFFYCIVNVLSNSLSIINSRTIINNVILLIVFSLLSIMLRPQILPIIYFWVVYVFFKRNFFNGLTIFSIGIVLFFNDLIIAEYLSKVSFEYLEAKKIEGASSVPSIAFEKVIVPKNIYELITLTPYLVFRFLFTPFPWELSNIRYSFAFMDSIVMIILFMLLAWNTVKGSLWNKDIIIFSFMFITILGVFEIAFTGAVRHRMPYILILSTLIMSLPKPKKLKFNY